MPSRLLPAAIRLPSGLTATLLTRPGMAGNSRIRFESSPMTRTVWRKIAVELGLAVRAADHDLVALRVPGDGRDAPLEGAGGDRGDVVDEPLGGDLGQLGRHVAADRDQVRAVGREDGVEHPVVVRAHEQDLLAGLGVDGPDAVVGAAEGDLRAVGRPARAVDRVEGDRDRERELPLGDVPDLDLAHPRRAAAGDGQLLCRRARTGPTRSARTARPAGRPAREPSAFHSRTSWNPATASSVPSGEKSSAVITGGRV